MFDKYKLVVGNILISLNSEFIENKKIFAEKDKLFFIF